MVRKKITVVCETDASDEDLRSAFLKCGLLDIRSVEVKGAYEE